MVRLTLRNSVWLLGTLTVGALWKHKSAEQPLLKRLRKGNSASFEELIKLNRSAVERYLSRRLPVDSVEDVVQETVLAAWINYESFDANRSFKLWMLGIAQNKARDFWRKRGNDLAPLDDASRLELNGYQQLEYQSVELRQCLEVAWSRLDANLREPIELYYAQSLTLPEIAQLLDTNLNTIKFRFYRAHALLADYLDPVTLEQLGKEHAHPLRKGSLL